MSNKQTRQTATVLIFKIGMLMVMWILFIGFAARAAEAQAKPAVQNVIFILSDDHRFDFMGFHPKSPSWLETPNMDRLAKEGVHLANAFVTTSLCSPSRASILTGMYMHRHRVVDNQRPVKEGTMFYPQYLQKAGIQTAFVGKWHMGHDHDDARPGFDHWVSFKGQGQYFDPELNINGKVKKFKGYNADVLAQQAVDWLKAGRDQNKRFFMHLAFKAVHYPFNPAKRHAGMYSKEKIDYPLTFARTERNYQTQPRWVKLRRYSIHGIDHMETGPFDKDPVPSFDALYHQYCEAVHSLDENLGWVLKYLDESGLAKNTLVIYMGDNGFHLGEHGFYDKRDAFETSMRVPMLARAPGVIKAGSTVDKMVLNIDIAPTVMDAMGVKSPVASKESNNAFDGHSFLPLMSGQGKNTDWRKHFVYEYHWEWNFPATPTLFAIRGDRYKYVYYHGTWDLNSFHDLKTDPIERHNLINVPAYKEQIEAMRDQMFKELTERNALDVPVRTPRGDRLDQRKIGH